MKKILTFALCLAAAGSISAQKQVVDQANKLAGKNDKITEARDLIKQAAANPETQNDARTYFVAGKIEFDAFDNSFKKQMINPKDPSVNPLEMGEQLLNGYQEFLKACRSTAFRTQRVRSNRNSQKTSHPKSMVTSMTISTQEAHSTMRRSFILKPMRLS